MKDAVCLEAKRNLILALVVLAPAFFCLLSSPNWTRAAFHSSKTPELYVRTLMTRAVLKSWFQCHMCDVNMRLKAIIKSTYNIQHYHSATNTFLVVRASLCLKEEPSFVDSEKCYGSGSLGGE